jgi:hypothetical protein
MCGCWALFVHTCTAMHKNDDSNGPPNERPRGYACSLRAHNTRFDYRVNVSFIVMARVGAGPMSVG